MELSKLQLDLRPRPNGQALDLGFALLRSHAKDVYLAWLALWLPLVATSIVLTLVFPGHPILWSLLPWWFRPLLERAPLYVLSRRVFGEAASWKDALRAWPRQLGGGWFRMLTWWRPFVIGRGLYQPIWQLENARGEPAAERRKVIGRNGTAKSAYWFGIVCAHFETILYFGFLAFIGIFLSKENGVNPFAALFGAGKPDTMSLMLLTNVAYGIAAGIIGPIYTACCFTLYLNRRAALEAWDIEIVLRQIRPPARKEIRSATPAGWIVAAVLALSLQPVPQAQAAAPDTQPATASAQCTRPDWMPASSAARTPAQNAAQAQLRREVDNLFDSDDLRGYVCQEIWKPKKISAPKSAAAPVDWSRLRLVAAILEILLIAGALFLLGWVLYRYREKFNVFFSEAPPKPATEVGGFDIRPDTLPADVAAAVHALWEKGERRSALALLYRATLSRLAHREAIVLSAAATEGDCLHAARLAHTNRRLRSEKFQVVDAIILMWLNGAYGNRWPDTAAVAASCALWKAEFDAATEQATRT